MTDPQPREAPAPPSKAAETGEIERFPRMVFRAGHTVRVWDKYDVDTLIVNSEAALRDALDHGWFVDPAKTADTVTPQRRKRRGRPPKAGRGADAKASPESPETDPDNIAYDPFKDPGNPRPNEPDNAPFRNTPYDEPQSGDLPDPPTSPPDPPVIAPDAATDVKPEDGEGLDKPPPGTPPPPLGGGSASPPARPDIDPPAGPIGGEIGVKPPNLGDKPPSLGGVKPQSSREDSNNKGASKSGRDEKGRDEKGR